MWRKTKGIQGISSLSYRKVLLIAPIIFNFSTYWQTNVCGTTFTKSMKHRTVTRSTMYSGITWFYVLFYLVMFRIFAELTEWRQSIKTYFIITHIWWLFLISFSCQNNAFHYRAGRILVFTNNSYFTNKKINTILFLTASNILYWGTENVFFLHIHTDFIKQQKKIFNLL